VGMIKLRRLGALITRVHLGSSRTSRYVCELIQYRNSDSMVKGTTSMDVVSGSVDLRVRYC